MPQDASIDFQMKFGQAPEAPGRSDEAEEIVLLGAFSGAAAGTASQRLAVSLDSLDDLINGLAPTIQIADESGTQLPIDFYELTHFHPDSLVERWPPCAQWRQWLKQLNSPETRDQALAALGLQTDTKQAPAAPIDTASEETSSDLAARLLGGKPPENKAAAKGSPALEKLLAAASASASSEAPSPTVETAQKEGLQRLSRALRTLLHSPAFQTLESTWLGLDWLLRRLPESDYRISIVDVSWAALQAEAQSGEDPATSTLHRLLNEHPNLAPPALTVGLFHIDASLPAVSTLARITAIAAQNGGRFTCSGDLALAGCTSTELLDEPTRWMVEDTEAGSFWNELRNHPLAQHLLLACPPFVLRQPFGEQSDPLEAFTFEELPPELPEPVFCWGSPALLIAAAFASGAVGVDQLPNPIYSRADGQHVQAPLKFLLTDRAAARAQALGLVPFRGSPQSDQVAL